MRIQTCGLRPYSLPFKQTWRSRHGVLNQRSGWIVELTTDTGLMGLGDCAPLAEAGTEPMDATEPWLNESLPGLIGKKPDHLLVALGPTENTPAARCALETALCDLLAQAEDKPLCRWFDPQAVDRLPVNGAAGALDTGATERCQNLLRQGFEVLKLKVGLRPLPEDIAQLQSLCQNLPAGIMLRLDANGAWSYEQAAEFLNAVSDLPIESLEEPLAQPTPNRLAELQKITSIALALDESLPMLMSVYSLSGLGVKRIILKPTVLGGPLSTLSLARQAQKSGLQVVVTSTLESAVGLHAAAQLAAAVHDRQNPLAHGLATGAWLTDDVAISPPIDRGWLRLSDRPGLGAVGYQRLPVER